MILKCAGWIALAWAGFLGCRMVAKMVPAVPPWLPQFTVKALMLLFALVAMKVSGRHWTSFGFWPAAPGSWKRASLVGLAMGALSTLTILLLGGKGMTSVLGGMSFPAIVVTVWIWSSFTEEVYTRAWLQSSLPAWQWLLSGLFFGSLHLSVIWAGADAVTGPVIVVMTTLLGLWAARLRERFDSLWPALWAHVAFNVGGLVGGILFAIQHVIRFGKPPAVG